MGFLSLLEKSTEFEQFKGLCQKVGVPPGVLRDYLVAMDLYDGTSESIVQSMVYLGKKHANHVTFEGPLTNAALMTLIRSQKVDPQAVALAYENPEDSERIIISIAGEAENGSATALFPPRELLQFVSGGAAKLKKIAASQRSAEKKKEREAKKLAEAQAREQKRLDAVEKKRLAAEERERQKAEREQARAEGRKLPRSKKASAPAATPESLASRIAAMGAPVPPVPVAEAIRMPLPPPAPVLTAEEFRREVSQLRGGSPQQEMDLDPDAQVDFEPPVVELDPQTAFVPGPSIRIEETPTHIPDALLARPGMQIPAPEATPIANVPQIDPYSDRDATIALAAAQAKGLTLIGEAFQQAADWVSAAIRELGGKK